MAEAGIPGATLVSVLRHGQVAGRADVLRGRSDEPLSPRGLEQMEAVAGRLAQPAFDAVAASPLRRCAVFAQAYGAAHRLPVALLPAFAEMDFGAWDGLTPAEAAHRDPAAFAAFRESAGRVAPPAGESSTDFRRRVGEGWRAWLADARGGHRLLVTHAGVMRVLLMELLGLPLDHLYRIALPEAAHFTISLLPGAAPILLNLNPHRPTCAG